MNKDLSTRLLEEDKRLAEQEQMYLVCGTYHRKHGNQQRATFFFSKANETVKKREQIQERLTIILMSVGINIPQADFVKPVNL